MLSNEQQLLEYVADILFKLLEEHPELCPHDYRWIGSTMNKGEVIDRYECNVCGERHERTRADLLERVC